MRSDLVGRERAIADVSDLLIDGQSVVTIVGPGGIGKTSVAAAIANSLREVFVRRDGAR